MQSIDIYNSSEIVLQRKESKVYKIFILIVLLFLVMLLLLMTLYKYDKISKLKGVVKDNKINLTLSENDLKLINSRDILVNGKKYKVSIDSISEAIYDSNYNAYYEVTLNIALNSRISVENNILDINILYGKTTFYRQVKERIKEGMHQ